MKVIIAEKKLVAEAIAKAILNSQKNNKGYISDNDTYVTWCSGHLLELAEPAFYNPELKKWNIESLPFYIREVKHVPVDRTKEQLKVVLDLLKKADTVYHCGDPDDEGQLIVDEVLDYAKFNKNVKRVIFNDNNPKIIAKAFSEAKDNSEYRHLGYKALGRSSSDWHYGLNLTRAFTVVEQRKGLNDLYSVGRVQDVIKGLVVRRCREIANFKPHDFFVINSLFNKDEQVIKGAKYQNLLNPELKDSDNLDADNRIISKVMADKIKQSIINNPNFKVVNVQVEDKSQRPPLPYNLLKLQMDMSRKFNISLDRTLEITQELRDQYNAITYNRSDCQYLNDETYTESPEILAQIANNAQIFKGAVGKADTTIKSKCFNTKIVNEHAHHAIIPTLDTFDFEALTEEQKKCYQLIARSFIAQFYPNHDYQVQTVTLDNGNNDIFTITTKSVINNGWKNLYKNDVGNEETEEEMEYTELDTVLKVDDILLASNADYDTKKTTPPSYYTEATLAGELTKVAKYIKNPELKKLMIEKDAGKKGEHGGIGTSATRSTIIKELFNKGFLVLDRKKIIATDKAYSLYDKLPDNAKYPDLTAIWHEDLRNIRTKEDSINFVQKVMRSVAEMVSELKTQYDNIEVKTYNCPTCDKEIRRVNAGKSPFWSCVGYKDQSCKYTCDDDNGVPTFQKAEYKPKKPVKKSNAKKGFSKY